MNVIFIGSYYQGVLGLKKLLSKDFNEIFHLQGIITSYSKRKLKNEQPVIKIAEKFNIPVFDQNINSSEFKNWYKYFSPDIIIMSQYNQIISPEILKLFPNYTFNIHPSDLPHNIGGAPYHYAMLRGEDLVITVHKVSNKIDRGDWIYKSSPIDITNTKIETLVNNIGPEQCAKAMEKVLHMIKDNLIVFHKIEGNPTFAWGNKLKKDLKIDWKESVASIARKINVCGAEGVDVRLNDSKYTKLKLFNAETRSESNAKEYWGKPIIFKKNYVLIGCNGGIISCHDFIKNC